MTRTDLTGEGPRQKVPGSRAEGSGLPGRRFLGSPALDLAEKKKKTSGAEDEANAFWVVLVPVWGVVNKDAVEAPLEGRGDNEKFYYRRRTLFSTITHFRN